jgi:hypothetical protein
MELEQGRDALLVPGCLESGPEAIETVVHFLDRIGEGGGEKEKRAQHAEDCGFHGGAYRQRKRLGKWGKPEGGRKGWEMQ